MVAECTAEKFDFQRLGRREIIVHRTLESWSRSRRVVGKAEYLKKGENPRFIITSLSSDTIAAAPLYEEKYCARGEMENRIKEQQLFLFAQIWTNLRHLPPRPVPD